MLAVLGLGAIVTVGLGLPGNLFGSAPALQNWSAQPAEVTVVDGETLRLGDRTLRLKGVDAPERGQTCRNATGASFDCAAASAEALSRLLGGRAVTCQIEGRDRFGRGLGRCAAGGLDLNLELVAAGFAIAAPGSRGVLVSAEAEARLAGRGLWSSGTPDAWRAPR